MNIPNPNEIFLNEFKTSCFIKNIVEAPNIHIGDYTYYDDSNDPTRFEKIMYCLTILNLAINSLLESFVK